MGSHEPKEERIEEVTAEVTGDSPGGAAVLEEEPIKRLRELGRALSRDVPYRIIELYLKDAPARLAELRRALSAGDARAVEGAAHSLKGSSANLGAFELAELCNELERLARRAVLNGAQAKVADLEAEYERVEKAMRELLAEFG